MPEHTGSAKMASCSGEQCHASSDLPPLAVYGTLITYFTAWVLLMWPHFLPVGRPGVAMIFALFVCFLRELCCVLWPEEHYPPVDIYSKIDPTPLVLLFGLMLVNSYLKDTGLWWHVERLLDATSPVLMLVKVCLCSALMSAVLLNDTVCIVLTPVVLNLCEHRKAQSALPFLMAVSTSSNIGSSLTIIGNPQNALIASLEPSISFLGFMQAMLVPVSIGLIINTVSLVVWFHDELVFLEAGGKGNEAISDKGAESLSLDDVESSVDSTSTAAEVATNNSRSGCTWWLYIAVVMSVVLAMVIAWLLGLAVDDVAVAAGIMLMFVRAVRRRWRQETEGETESDFALASVDFSILVLFIGQFILVGATVDTGVPQKAFSSLLGDCTSGLMESFSCLAWFAFIVMVLSNIISNVPVVLMLQPLLAGLPKGSATSVWITCAFVATISGNLTMLGSAANLIVAHVAEGRGVHSFTAIPHFKFSFVPTLVITFLGVACLGTSGMFSFSWLWIVAVAAVGVVPIVARTMQESRDSRRPHSGSWGDEQQSLLVISDGECPPSQKALGLFTLSLLSACEGLGPFAGAWLTANPARKYSPAELGSLNAFQQVLMTVMQPLLGSLVDRCTLKRALFGFGSLCVGAGVVVTVFAPQYYSLMWAIQVPTAFGQTMLPLALSSMTLGIMPTGGFTQQVALNNIGTHIGTVLSCCFMAVCAIYVPGEEEKGQQGQQESSLSPTWGLVPLVFSVCCVAALGLVRHSDIDHRRAAGFQASAPAQETGSPQSLLSRRAFWQWLALNFTFNVANMAQLQILVQRAASLIPEQAIVFTSAAQILAHSGMTLAAWVAGRQADGLGRKPLLISACAVVLVRALLTGAVDQWWIVAGGSPWLGLLVCQALDGVGAGLWGVLNVLVTEDVSAGTGCFNLALGSSQALFAVGAVVSSELAGQLAGSLGFAAAFLALGVAGLVALVQATAFPETKREKSPDGEFVMSAMAGSAGL